MEGQEHREGPENWVLEIGVTLPEIKKIEVIIPAHLRMSTAVHNKPVRNVQVFIVIG